MTAPLLPSPARPRVTWLQLLAVMAVTFAVFTPVLRTGFSPLDDYSMILQNEKVTAPTWPHFSSFWTETSFHIYMPLALSAWQLIAWATHSGTVGGMDFALSPVPFKVVSILTHALAAAGTAWAISILTRTRWPAIIGGLVFALHPMQVESIAWTTGLKDELCGLFTILAIGCYARHAERDPVSPARDVWWWLGFVAALLATFSKPTSMVLPVLLIAVDWTMRQTSVARRFVSIAAFMLPAISVALVILSAQGGSNVAKVAAVFRPLVATDAYAFYLSKLVWPLQLSIDYGRRPPVVLSTGAIWWTWLLPAAVLVAVLMMRSRRWVLAAVLFVVPVLPVSGLTVFDMQQFSTVTDHYVYQSLAGAGLAAALLVRRWPRVAGGAGVAVLLASSVLTYRTAAQWENLETLYSRMLSQNPHSWMARDLLGVLAGNRGDLFTVKRLFDASLRDDPKDGAAMDNQSGFLLALMRYREAAIAAEQATQHLNTYRIGTAKRLTLLGAKLKDPIVAEKGLTYWRLIEPDNKYVADMLASVRMAKQLKRWQTVSSAPTTSAALSAPATIAPAATMP